jgi:filamentous hemagglutinin family protein
MNHVPARLRTHPVPHARFARRVLAAALASAFGLAPGAASAQVLPTGPVVVHGTANIDTSSEKMVIRNSPNAVLNWQSFSIGASNTVRFEQDNAASKVLNRVLGKDPSSIFGSLSSNGEVWLVNPNGVLFGANARVDVGALVASTLGVTDADFLAGRASFGLGGVSGGPVRNQGTLTSTSLGGHVWLIGGSVRNEGDVTSQGGQIVLAAGQGVDLVDLVDSGAPNVTVRIAAPGNEVVNLGTLLAPGGGTIDLHGAIVNQQGIVRADSLGAGAAGSIVIRATGDVVLADGSETSASADSATSSKAAGGQVTVESTGGKSTILGGVSATGVNAAGGRIRLLGRSVEVDTGEGSIDVSGSAGGEVLVGTAQLAAGTDVANADTVLIDATTRIRANGGSAGDGGSIVVRSDGATQIAGSLQARSGASAGRGGTVETSGALVDTGSASIDVGAPEGTGGSWLLQADNLAVIDAGCPLCGQARASGPESTVSNALVRGVLEQGARVRLEAGSPGALPQTGNLRVTASLYPANPPPAGAALTLAANKDLDVTDGLLIGSASTPLPVTLIADLDGSGDGAMRLGAGTQIITDGAELRLGGGTAGTGRAQLVALSGTTLDAGTGNLSIAATAVNIGSNSRLYGGEIGILGGTLALDRVEMIAQAGGKPAIVSLSGDTVDIARTVLSADGYVRVAGATAISLDNATLEAAGQGDAIVLSTARLSATESVLSPRGGRWLVYLDTLSAFSPTLFDTLGYTFVQVGANGAGAPAAPLRGNGVVVRAPMDVRVQVDATRVYDGTTQAAFSTVLADDLATGFVLQTHGGPVQGRFADKNVGAGKAIGFGDAVAPYGIATTTGQPVYGAAQAYVADITPRPLTAALGAADKVYDGTRTATVSGSLVGAIAGDDVRLSGATGLFDTRDAGVGKTVAVTGALGGIDAGNYRVSIPSTVSAAITQRPLDIVLVGDVRKEYDATTQASLDGAAFRLDGTVAGDALSVRGPAQGSFATADVGQAKLVSASGAFEIDGARAANYRIGTTGLSGTSNLVQASASGNIGTITPATLVYEAFHVSAIGGVAFGPFDGTVTGFKGGDTLASATNGTLSWQGAATPASAPGAYAVNGSGLSAGNYRFVQAPGNATALELEAAPAVATGTPAGAPQQRALDSSALAIDAAVHAALPTVNVQAMSGAVFDRSGAAPARSFEPARIESMNQDELGLMLAERKDFKRKLFADAIYKLSIDPSLADVRPCASTADTASGTCRITPEQVAAIKAAQAAAASPVPAAGTHDARARVASLPQIERKIAVLIGINDYADQNIPQLVNSIPDVDALARVFAGKLGYDVRVVRNPGKADIVRVLNALAAEADGADSVVIYYAGHGETLDNSSASYWLAADASVTDPKSWISNADVARLLSGVRSRQVALISDSCYSGIFAREGLGAIGKHVLADDVLAKRSVVVLSSGGDEPVADEGKDGHSIFAWHLIRAIGAMKDWEPGSTLFSDVRAAVRKEFPQTPTYGSLTAAGHQAGGEYLFETRSN